MIWAAIVIAKDGKYEITSGKIVGVYVVLLIIHGTLVRTVRLVKQLLTCLIADHRRAELPCDASSRDLNEGIRIRQPWYIRACVMVAPFVFVKLITFIHSHYHRLASDDRAQQHALCELCVRFRRCHQSNKWMEQWVGVLIWTAQRAVDGQRRFPHLIYLD
jgi:hypothetical protein